MIYINDISVQVTMFPDKTSQVWKLPPQYLDTKVIRWVFENEGEFLRLAQLKTLLDKANLKPLLVLKYLPYGRQDKQVDNNATFALYAFAKLLNALEFRAIEIIDPHSNIALQLIHNSFATYPTELVEQIAGFNDNTILCYPDKGALTKYSKLYNKPYIYGEKARDQLTGNILKYSIVGNPIGKNILIVDDICDYGRTFILLAKNLYESGAKEVNMFVTHGLFSGGIKVLTDAGIKRIFTQDGECFEDNGKIINKEDGK